MKLPFRKHIQPKAKLIRSLENLKFRDFFEISKTGKFEKLIIEGNPTQDELTACWSDIIDQWTAETNGPTISSQLLDSKFSIEKQNKIIGLAYAYMLLNYGSVEGIEIAKYFGVMVSDASNASATQIKTRILQLNTEMTIQAIKKSEKETKEDLTFYDIILAAEDALERVLNHDMNCMEWIATKRLIEKKITAQKKAANGRSSKRG